MARKQREILDKISKLRGKEREKALILQAVRVGAPLLVPLNKGKHVYFRDPISGLTLHGSVDGAKIYKALSMYVGTELHSKLLDELRSLQRINPESKGLASLVALFT